MVELRELGKTEIRITPIGLGCWQFSGGKGLAGRFWPNLDDGVEDEIVRISLEHGVNWFDTAEMYGGGASELSLNRALKAAGATQDDAADGVGLFSDRVDVSSELNEYLRVQRV